METLSPAKLLRGTQSSFDSFRLDSSCINTFMESLSITSAPNTLPVSIADLKTHLRLTSTTSAEDDYLTDLAWMSYSWIEQETDLTISQTEYLLKTDCFSPTLVIPKPPLISIDSVTYYDSNNQSQTLTEGTDFYLMNSDKQSAFIEAVDSFPSVYSRPDAVQIAFTSGFATVPRQIEHLMRLLVGSAWENREGEIVGTITTQVKLGVDRLLNQIRNWRYV